MNIYIQSGKGEGITELSSFDAALKEMGVYNYNLISLSSVIPPQTTIIIQDYYESVDNEYGNKLYVVKAEERSSLQGEYIGAAIGWYQWGDNRGVFVEHHSKGKNLIEVENSLKKLVYNSLQDLCRFRNVAFNNEKVGIKESIARVENIPTSVVVLAVYQSDEWKILK